MRNVTGPPPLSPPRPAGWSECDGVFVSPEPVGVDPEYPEHLRDWLATIEPKHFWFRSRAQLIAATVRAQVGGEGWLELGCGNGYVLAEVGRRYRGPCFGQELSRHALTIARTRTTAALYLCPPHDVPLRNLSGVGFFDVIEHLPDDVAGLRIARRYLKTGGVVLLTVPAHPWLWSQADEVSGHQRRYTRNSLVGVMESAGLRVEFCRPFFGSLLPELLLRRTIRLRDPNAALRMFLQPPPMVVNEALRAITQLEGRLCRLGLTPFGTSLLALGRNT